MQQQYEPGDLVEFTDEIYQIDDISQEWKDAIQKALGKAIRVISSYSETIVKLEIPNGPSKYCLTSTRYIKPCQEQIDTSKFLDALIGSNSNDF